MIKMARIGMHKGGMMKLMIMLSVTIRGVKMCKCGVGLVFFMVC